MKDIFTTKNIHNVCAYYTYTVYCRFFQLRKVQIDNSSKNNSYWDMKHSRKKLKNFIYLLQIIIVQKFINFS